MLFPRPWISSPSPPTAMVGHKAEVSRRVVQLNSLTLMSHSKAETRHDSIDVGTPNDRHALVKLPVFAT